MSARETHVNKDGTPWSPYTPPMTPSQQSWHDSHMANMRRRQAELIRFVIEEEPS